MKDSIYDHHIATGWSIKNMANARMTKKFDKITVIDDSSDIAVFRVRVEHYCRVCRLL